MKTFTLVSSLFVSLASLSSVPASAAIMMIPLNCGELRDINTGNAVLGVGVEVECETLSAISGNGTNCQLATTVIAPGAQPRPVPLTLVSETNTLVIFKGENVELHFYKTDESAKVLFGGNEGTVCAHVAPKF